MKSTNRKWQNHLKSKGIIPFFLDRLQNHAMSSNWQHPEGSFNFPIKNRNIEDELSKAYFEFIKDFPYEFHIEVTSHCNLNCLMCARSKLTRPLGNMKFDLFSKIIDEISNESPYAYIHFYGIGEPLMDPNIFEKLSYAKLKGLKNTVLFTNGQLLLKNDNYKKLADSGLASIGIDLDGFSQEVYGKIRVGGEFDLVKQGIEKLSKYILENKLRTRLEIAYQVYPKINDLEIETFIEWCEKENYEYKLVNMHNWAGLREDVPKTNVEKLADLNYTKRKAPCPVVWNGFFIGWDGKCTYCFQDADFKDFLGELKDSTIKEIWQGPCFEKQKKHINGIFDGVCENCVTCTNVDMPEFNSSLYGEF